MNILPPVPPRVQDSTRARKQILGYGPLRDVHEAGVEDDIKGRLGRVIGGLGQIQSNRLPGARHSTN
jgi:hypothetical protein